VKPQWTLALGIGVLALSLAAWAVLLMAYLLR